LIPPPLLITSLSLHGERERERTSEMMNLRWRFVNLVVENCTSSVCSLHRLDVSEHLFYPSTVKAEAAARRPAVVSTLALLPASTHNFRPAAACRYNIYSL